MESLSGNDPDQVPPGEVSLDDDPAETDALLDKIAEENINAQTAARPESAETPETPQKEKPLAADGASITEAIIDPQAGPCEQEIVNDIDSLLADISGIADAAQPPAVVDTEAPAEETPVEQENVDTLEGDPEALLAAAEELAAAGGTRLEDETNGPPESDAQPEDAEPAAAEDLDRLLAARAEELEADEEIRLDDSPPEEVDQQFVPGPESETVEPAPAADRDALLASDDLGDEPTPATADATAVEIDRPAAGSRRRPLTGVAGWVMRKLIHLVEAPIARLSNDARYTVSFVAVAFLIASVTLLAYALFFAH